MWDKLLELLEPVNAAEFLIYIALAVWIGKKAYVYGKGIYDKIKGHVTTEINDNTEKDNLIRDVAAIKDDLEALRKETLEKFNAAIGDIGEELSSVTDRKMSCMRKIDALETNVQEYSVRLQEMQVMIDQLRVQIDTLFTSDKEYFNAYIVEVYNKYVKEVHEIDLITLQSLEGMYNKYLEEGGADEFTARLMRELRDLPTTTH